MDGSLGKKKWDTLELLMSVADHLEAVVFVLDPDGRFLLSMGGLLKTLGLTSGQVVGMSAFELYADSPTVIDLLNRAFQGQEAAGENQIGDLWFRVQYYPVFQEDQLDHLIGIATDITALKNAEAKLQERESQFKTMKELSEKELFEAESMSSLGRMVAGVAHEINTPLGIGVTDASFLEDITKHFEQKFLGEGLKRSEVEKFLAQLKESTASLTLNLAKATRLVESFKSVAADRSSEIRRLFFVGPMIEDILLSLHNKIKQTKIRVNIQCPTEAALDNYPGAFNQVLSNLVINSLTHGFEPFQEGRIDITVTTDTRGILLVYQDSGRGVPPENLGRIFEPFYTTRRGHGGTGLGLSILRSLVYETMGGMVKASSPPGEGLRFEIHLPHLQEQTPQ